MNNWLGFLLIASSLCVGMLALLEVGRRVGLARMAKDPEGATKGVGAVEGAVFGLMGLLIAFTFSGAAARFDQRRDLVVRETNVIGTAYLRIDLLSKEVQTSMREKFRQYVDSRLAFYKKLHNTEAAQEEANRTAVLQQEIWTAAVADSRQASSPAVMTLVLQALNDMIDITTVRAAALMTHPPLVIYVMLGVLVLACSLLAGYDMAGDKGRNWLHMLGFAAIMTIAIYVILDLEYPRVGLIRVDDIDKLLIDLRQTMK
jgi:hypothetical protein